VIDTTVEVHNGVKRLCIRSERSINWAQWRVIGNVRATVDSDPARNFLERFADALAKHGFIAAVVYENPQVKT
jgi:hypothetical protein